MLKALGAGPARARWRPFDLEVYEGEVVGLAGLLGSGRTELARLLFGADRADRGELQVRGRPTPAFRSPRHAIDRTIAFSCENRRAEGVIEDLTRRATTCCWRCRPRAAGCARSRRRRRDELVAEYIEALDIRPADPDALVRNLSGGNQQKVLLARWLITEPELLILDEPTRGIDIGAKAQIQQLVARARPTTAWRWCSSPPSWRRCCGFSDRLVVMRDRRKIAELAEHDDVERRATSWRSSPGGGRGREEPPPMPRRRPRSRIALGSCATRCSGRCSRWCCCWSSTWS